MDIRRKADIQRKCTGSENIRSGNCQYQSIFYYVCNLVVDKSAGKLTTGDSSGTGTNTKLFLGTSLEIINGTFELATTDDIEGRLFNGTASTPAITVRAGGIFNMAGSSSHIRRGNFIGDETGKIGMLTVFGKASLVAGSSNKTNFSGISIESGGFAEFATSKGTLSSYFNPGVLMIKNGGVFKNSLITTYWYTNPTNPNGLNVESGGEFYTSSGTTQLPQVVTINGNIRFGGTTQTIPAGLPSIHGTVYLANSGTKTLGGALTVNGKLMLFSTATFSRGIYALSFGPNAVLQYGESDSEDSESDNTTPQTTSDNEFPSSGGPSNLLITNSGGVTLHSNRTITGTVAVSKGTLNTGSYELTLGDTASVSETSGGIIIGTVKTTRTVSRNVTNIFGGIGLSITAAGGAPGSTLVLRKSGTAITSNGAAGIKRYVQVAPANNTGLNADVSFSFDESELNGIAENNLVLFQSADQSIWNMLSSVTNSVNNTLTITNLNSLGYFTAGSTVIPLPVEISTFTSIVNGRNVQLAWETKTEKNSSKFLIERSVSGSGNWDAVGTVIASVLSNSPKQYSFTDKDLQVGKYQYRLKMIDNDGTFRYSKVIETEIAQPKNFELSQNYPNPFNPSTRISYSIPNDSRVTLDVYSISGEKVAQLVNEDQLSGYYSVNFGNKFLSSGVYLYRISAMDKATGKEFSSVKKMMLLK
jgi:hypothetical protein